MQDGDVRPRLTDANLLLNEAIREYLEFAGYRHTLSVFLTEAGQPAEPLRRDFVSHKLGLPPVVAAETPSGESPLEMCERSAEVQSLRISATASPCLPRINSSQSATSVFCSAASTRCSNLCAPAPTGRCSTRSSPCRLQRRGRRSSQPPTLRRARLRTMRLGSKFHLRQLYSTIEMHRICVKPKRVRV